MICHRGCLDENCPDARHPCLTVSTRRRDRLRCFCSGAVVAQHTEFDSSLRAFCVGHRRLPRVISRYRGGRRSDAVRRPPRRHGRRCNLCRRRLFRRHPRRSLRALSKTTTAPGADHGVDRTARADPCDRAPRGGHGRIDGAVAVAECAPGADAGGRSPHRFCGGTHTAAHPRFCRHRRCRL